MKKLLTLIATVYISINLIAQAPQKMSYQAVIRNASNNLVTNAPVKMRISILEGSTTGTAVYSELHSATTNANGLATIEIGTGISQQGTFSNINWGNGTYFLRTETDPNNGTNYSIVGTSQLLSVPYAIHANCVSSTLSGDTLIVGCKKYVIPGIIDANAPPTLNNGLVAYYPFNGNANDESGNGNNGTINNTIFNTDRKGSTNKAYSFNGQSSFISIPSSITLNSPNSTITFCAWININEWYLIPSDNTRWFPILSKSNSNLIYGNYRFGVQLLPGSTKPNIYATLNSDTGGAGEVNIALKSWYHIVAIIDDTNNKYQVYLNGSLISEGATAFTGWSTSNNLPLIIGKDEPGLVDYANGIIDEVRIYKRALTQEEITYLYNN
jgi:hypothetical protein